jgi:hypothetical protein
VEAGSAAAAETARRRGRCSCSCVEAAAEREAAQGKLSGVGTAQGLELLALTPIQWRVRVYCVHRDMVSSLGGTMLLVVAGSLAAVPTGGIIRE